MKKGSLLKFVFCVAIVLSVNFTASPAWAPANCFNVVKNCIDGTIPGDPITYQITVTTCGYGEIYVTVMDSTLGTTFYTGELDNSGPTTWSVNFTDYPPECGVDFTNTVEATGIDRWGDPFDNLEGNSTDSSTCMTPCEEEPPNPCIEVTKDCTDAEYGEPIEYTGIVRNCGDVPLSVTLHDQTFGTTIFVDQPLAAEDSTSYSFTVLAAACGFDIVNTIEAIGTYTPDVGDPITVSAEANAECMMRCEEEGCTLTPGYWKTHSDCGPALRDDTWDSIGEGTAFFSSGNNYCDVLWWSPRGNAYYILAHAYIAAVLNQNNGASIDAVSGELDDALVLFNSYTPAAVLQLKKNKDPKYQEFIDLAKILDKYNNGDGIGPGHCD